MLRALGLDNLTLRSTTQPWEAEGISARGSVLRYVGAFLISLVVLAVTIPYFLDAPGWVLLLDLALGVVAFAVVHQRRRRPMVVAVGLCLLSIVSGTAAGPATLASVSVAARRQWLQVLVVGLANLVAAQGYNEWTRTSDSPYLLDLAINVAVVAAMMAWGMYVGSRRELMHNLRLRAEQAEAEQELRAAKAQGDERARIAREMHDVLAHRISQVAMLSGALAFRTDLTADQMREHAGLLQTQANAALDDLRAVLGVLRDRTSGEPMDRPQPTWSDVPALVAESRRTGMQVTFDDRVEDADGLATTIGRTAYRMVQEALTNARKHAPGAVVHVHAKGSADDGLTVTVRNPLGFGRGTAPGSGLGLVGLAERAALVDGTLEHGRRGDEFVVQVWLPWTP